jgi:Zinc carboxypeptidase
LHPLEENPYLKKETLGFTPKMELPIDLLTISDFNVADTNKKRIWLQARTHPAETSSSFLLEGLINFLLSDQMSAKKIRENFIYHIIPMHNPDGVVAGNYRTNIDSVDLERNWIYDKDNPTQLSKQVALENRLLHSTMQKWLNPQDIPAVSVALNLHSSNEPVNQAAFFFPHFGNMPRKYNQQQCALYKKQLKLIRLVSRFYRDFYGGSIALPPHDGGSAFLSEHFPETWWWMNRQDQVVAMTLETVYGKAGFDHWVTTDDIRHLGEALAYGITCYFKLHF